MNEPSTRSPLYRVEEFFRTRDVPLLLGGDMAAEMLNNDAIGRVFDRIYDCGTWKLNRVTCTNLTANSLLHLAQL